MISDTAGAECKATALIDPGSQLNLVTLSLVRQLELRMLDEESIAWSGTGGSVTRSIGSVLLHVDPPPQCGVSERVAIWCYVAPDLPFDMVLRMPQPASIETEFWTWRAAVSRDMALQPRPSRRHHARRRLPSTLATAVAALAVCPAVLPDGEAWRVFRDGEFALAQHAVPLDEADVTLQERVADSVAAPAPDLATVPLDVPTDTPAVDVAALRATLLEFAGAPIVRLHVRLSGGAPV